MHIIRDDKTGILINLKSLDPRRITHIINNQGLIIAYEYDQGAGKKPLRLKKEEVFHSMNNRILA